jgi:hypothetical protein
LSSKLFLFYFSKVSMVLFAIFAFAVIMKLLFCPWVHWSDQNGQKWRNGSIEPNHHNPLSLTRLDPRVPLSGDQIAFVVASLPWLAPAVSGIALVLNRSTILS